MGLKIDLGCGNNKAPGFVGVDVCKQVDLDIRADIRRPIPGLEDGCAELVRCSHVLEHLDGDEWRLVMREIARLLQHRGRFEIRVPHPSDENAMIHGHRCVFTPLYWRHIQEGLHGRVIEPLKIDRVTEVPKPVYLEFCKAQGLNPVTWAPFLSNSFGETEVWGHKE